jgi:hypothetical protein
LQGRPYKSSDLERRNEVRMSDDNIRGPLILSSEEFFLHVFRSEITS